MSYCDNKSDCEIKTEYSLVKHLNILCSQDEKYKDLCAAWTLDKEVYSKALSNIVSSFPHYSMHDSSHSASIVNKIEMLLGEDRIKSLSPTDTFMILESAYLHDFGMLVSNAELLEEWQKPKFQRFLKSLEESTYDEDIAKSAKLILGIDAQDKKTLDLKDYIEWPVDVKNAVIIISAEYFRKRHNIRSANWIENPQALGIDINFNKLIPDRIIRLIGKVSISHGTSFEDTFSSLDKVGNGIGTDKVHPRFIGCLLRIGDLLDLDNGRFNPVSENTCKFPESSNWHKEKHASITHFLVCPQRIEVSAVCKDDKVYRVTREWFDSLKEELKNLSSRWAEIVPEGFQGGPPSLGDIKLSIENAEKITEQLDLRFSIDQKRAFELIEGSGIYNTELVFIRELLQNALDASKMQMWKDIENKKYDCIDKSVSEKARKKELYFYDDIPENIRAFYPININIDYEKNESEGEYIFTIEDRGCGISIDDLKRMENVGGSWKQDDALADFIESMPEFLKPTGSFGMGIHSVFMITDEMKINTKSEEDKAYNISFVSRRKNGYITVKEDSERKNIGTKITLKIKEKRMQEVIENSDESYYFDEYDCFNNRYEIDNVCANLARYIKKYTNNIKVFNINCFLDGKNLNKFGIVTSEENSKNKKHIERTYSFDEKGLNYDIYFDNKGILKTEVRDRKNCIIVIFSTCLPNSMMRNSYVRLRSIPSEIRAFFKEMICDENDINVDYFNIELNIFKGEAKNVLDVSRNNLKKSIANKYSKIIDKIFKECMITIVQRYLKDTYEKKEIRREIEDKISNGNINYEISMLMLRLAYNKCLGREIEPACTWGNKFIVDYCYKIIDKDKVQKDIEEVTVKQFISSKRFAFYKKFFRGYYGRVHNEETLKKELIERAGKLELNTTIIMNNVNSNFKWLLENFKITKVDENGYIIIEECNNTALKCFNVNKETKVYRSIMDKMLNKWETRSVIYPITYKKDCSMKDTSTFECLVMDKIPKSLNYSLEFDKYCIISPFVNISKNYCLNMNIKFLITYLKKKANFDELVKYVAINSVQNKDKKIEEGSKEYKVEIEKVEAAYEQLIKDYIEVEKKIQEEKSKIEEKEIEKNKEEQQQADKEAAKDIESDNQDKKGVPASQNEPD